MEHKIPFGKFQPGKRANLFRFSTFSGNFHLDEPTKRFPFSTQPKFPKILTKWEAPLDKSGKSWFPAFFKKQAYQP